MDGAILHTEGLTVGYGGAAVVSDIALSARQGQVLALIGPNGAGKSTILKTLIRQLGPLSGTVYLEGREMSSLRSRDVARSVAAVLTGRPAPELMTCLDVVATGRYPYTGRLGVLSKADWDVVDESMELVRVSELRDRDFDRISDGQRQRVLLARAICQQPRLLIMDEPTSFLDIRHKLDFLWLLRDLVRRRQIAAVLSLHELELAQRYADTLLCVRGGRVDRLGPPEEIFRGDYIAELYGVEHGGYNALLGGVESQRVSGAPEVFVVGGGGSGVPLYRFLQRRGVPFAAGVLQESDVDHPVARDLAAAVVSEAPFAPVGEAALAEALSLLERCGTAVCTLERFGPMNAGNERLVSRAGELGILKRAEELYNER